MKSSFFNMIRRSMRRMKWKLKELTRRHLSLSLIELKAHNSRWRQKNVNILKIYLISGKFVFQLNDKAEFMVDWLINFRSHFFIYINFGQFQFEFEKCMVFFTSIVIGLTIKINLTAFWQNCKTSRKYKKNIVYAFNISYILFLWLNRSIFKSCFQVLRFTQPKVLFVPFVFLLLCREIWWISKL